MSSQSVAYVLSPSRTGTLFLETLFLEHFPSVSCAHEPSPSRTLHVLGNVRNHLGIGGGLVKRWFERSLGQRRAAAIDKRYVEINPLLCPITDLLIDTAAPPTVIHLVRDPRTWVPSILSFKASPRFRHVVERVPFLLPYPAPLPRGWARTSMEERALWRWRYCNEQILQIANDCERYALIRYEDLFAKDEQVRRSALARIIRTIDLEEPEGEKWLEKRERINEAPYGNKKPAVPDERRVQSICGPILERFGYQSV
ncbi:MAG: hypothetical protein E4H03_07795 [Myxococcales bacterium]|jgi:hypothetical protein|nr:MAG: hypothetical protein E4H03_07795 [Myxococcales bacterium]